MIGSAEFGSGLACESEVSDGVGDVVSLVETSVALVSKPPSSCSCVLFVVFSVSSAWFGSWLVFSLLSEEVAP